MPPGSRQAMPMIAIGVERRLDHRAQRYSRYGIRALAFRQFSRLAVAATYWTRDQCLHIERIRYQAVTLTGAKVCEA